MSVASSGRQAARNMTETRDLPSRLAIETEEPEPTTAPVTISAFGPRTGGLPPRSGFRQSASGLRVM